MNVAARSAMAMIVICGLTPSDPGTLEPSQMKRLWTSWVSWVRSTTYFSGSFPMRAVPSGW